MLKTGRRGMFEAQTCEYGGFSKLPLCKRKETSSEEQQFEDTEGYEA